MASMSDFLESKLADHVFRGTAYTAPTTIFFALFTAAPSDAGGGTEVTGGSYARVGVTANTTNFTVPGTSGTTSNASTITFPAPTANWGTVTHLATFDASTGGNMLSWGALTASKTINNGDQAPIISASGWSFQFDN